MDSWGAAELTVVKFCRHASGGSPDPSELARPAFRFPAFALIRTDGGRPHWSGERTGQVLLLIHRLRRSQAAMGARLRRPCCVGTSKAGSWRFPNRRRQLASPRTSTYSALS